jgi:hypothetical protein
VADDCSPPCPTCMGRGSIRKRGYADEDEDVRPGVRVWKACLQGLGEAGRR